MTTNRLSKEKSPYLLQHAHNPVNWYPWGEEAFQAAREEDKPIFLSIGYATCHWCHVMEKESFENQRIADLMNEAFINIKVDREELPHIDSLYMEFAQSMMSGTAGWPLNLILTPALQPFFAATYLPPTAKHGLMGLDEVITRIREVWHGEEKERIENQAEKLLEVFSESVHVKGNELPEKEIVEDTADLLFKMSDPTFGGMSGAPKFPIGYQYDFLMHIYPSIQDSRGLFLVERTLDRMQRGGIYDHLGGGFSRYSIDEKWLVPHFEKMLYDNALLINTYLQAWQVTKKPLYKEVCEEICHYILRDMQHPEGGFYSAEDADSEGKEGFFYTWTQQEIEEALGKEESVLFCSYYGVTEAGNFEGRTILNTPASLSEFAAAKGLELEELKATFQKQRETLFKVREKRVHPLKDDKILSSWNGLTIAALAYAGCAFERQDFVDSALKAAHFIRKNLWREGRLFRRWREGEACFNAGLDEYSFLIKGVLALFETGYGTEWLAFAMEMEQILRREFKADDGAFFQADLNEKNMILRKAAFGDGAEPAGNSIHCENLLKFYQLTNDALYLDQAEEVFRAADKFIKNYPPGYCYQVMNLARYYDKRQPLLVIALGKEARDKEKLLKEIYQTFIPHKGVVWKEEGDQEIKKLLPVIADKEPLAGKTTLYICFEGACQPPLTDFDQIVGAIHKL